MSKSPLHAAKSDLFNNCIIEAPDGVVLGRCAQKKVQWYLDRDMADLVSENPTTIRLRFEPRGRKGVNDPFNLIGKPNLCVVCGSTENLTRHHVIPHCIVKHMPLEYKCHNSHDVVPLCVACHSLYEDKSYEKKKQLADEAGISVHGHSMEELKKSYRLRSLSTAVALHGDKMPPERRVELLEAIKEIHGYEPDMEEIVKLSLMDPKEEVNYIPFGEVVVGLVDDFNEFARSWRQHFLDVMQPKFMIEHWRVDRKFEEDWIPKRLTKTKDA